MALPLLAPFAWLLPLFKILALGSIKFIGVGLGAAVAPVLTANFLVGMSSGTPLKYAKFRHKKGYFSQEQLDAIEHANQLVLSSMEEQQDCLSRSEAREFLKEVLVGTVANMKQSILGIPGSIARVSKQAVSAIAKLFSPGGK